MNRITLKIVNTSHHPLPIYQTDGASGMDLCANLDSSIEILPMHRSLIPTGLFIEIPDGYEAQVRPRSGLAIKHGITVLNSPGTIDSDYRGEIQIILINLSENAFVVEDGDRIAQLVLSKVEKIDWQVEQELSSTNRSAKGFGHTGFSNNQRKTD